MSLDLEARTPLVGVPSRPARPSEAAAEPTDAAGELTDAAGELTDAAPEPLDAATGPAGTAPGGLLPGLPGGDARLRAVIGAAAAFPDRAGAGQPGSLFVPEPPAERAATAAMVGRWLDRAAGEPGAAGVLVEHLAATGRPLGDGLRPVALRADAPLPDWGLALTAFLRAQPVAPDAAALAPGSLAASFRRAAGALLPVHPAAAPLGALDATASATSLAVLGVPVAPAALEQLTDTLAARLSEACRLSFCYEVQAATGRPGADDWHHQDGLDASQQGWLARLERLPALAYLVGTVCRNWQRVTVEMFARLAADRDLLRERLWAGAEPGALAAVRADAGDRHAGGRSVALLHFEHGQAVVYKPKDLRHATAYMELVHRLNRHAAEHPEDGLLDLPTRQVLLRDDLGGDSTTASLDASGQDAYGWEELVPAGPCADRSGFARYYRRLGMTMRLVQLLEGRDLWADNLLASGEHPHLTDLECLLYPRVQTPPALPAGQRGLLDLLETTVVRTAMAAQPWVASKDRPALDIGCLTRAGGHPETPAADTLPLPPYRPVHDGETADPWQYTEEVVAGYRAAHAALYRLRDELADEAGPLAGFRGIWVRYIWRHTWDGYKILNASTSPLALGDGATRETVLAGALRGAVAARAGDAERGDLLEVVLSELDSFRQLDIPFFRSLTTSSSVFATDGREIPGHFQGTGWRRLLGRVAELEAFDLEWHTAVLSGCLDAALGGSERAFPGRPGAPALTAPAPAPALTEPGVAAAFRPAASGELLERAVELGDLLLADRHRAASGAGWLGLSWYPLTGLRQVEALGGVDLVSSGTGAALFLAELWHATGEPRYRQAAHETLAAAAAIVDPDAPHGLAFARDGRLALGAPVPGGLAGPGALIHALARGGELLGDPDFAARARRLVPAALALAAEPEHPTAKQPAPMHDLPLGSAGLLLNLLRLRQARPGPADAELDAAIRQLADRAQGLLADRAARGARGEQQDPRYAHPTRLLDLLPTGPDSLAAALARTLGQSPRLLTDPDAARALLRGHSFTLLRRSGRLAALDAAVSLGTDALDARQLGLLACPVGAEQLAALGTRALVATAGEALAAAEAGLLHAVPDDVTPLVRGPFYDGREAASVLVGELLRRRAATGSWYGDRAAADRINLGALDGATAVGLLLLRLLDPATAPLATLR